ncbi:MAG: N-acetylmuramoyl-L-alanine amidase, partial [Gemmatimonadetes bacterium]|nr:N-acetylmuramoyl-L-alanine amidase [Gemmatimonadota bacterium]
GARRPRVERLPEIAARRGPPALDVVYPDEGAALSAADSNFVFGGTGTGDATLSINGAPVDVAPNGAFLAYLPVPADGVYRFRAAAGGREASLTRRVRVPATAGADTGFTVATRGVESVAAGEMVEVRVRGPRGAQVRLVLPDSTGVPLREQTSIERPEGFLRDRAAPAQVTEYVGSFSARAPLLSRDRAVGAWTLAPAAGRAGTARVEVAADGRTRSLPVELSLGVLPEGRTRTGVGAGARLDGMVIARALPGSGTPYQWFFPNGTKLTLTGEKDGQYRVRLTGDLSVWVDAKDVRLLPEGALPARGTVGTVRMDPQPGWVDVRLALSDRLPFRVDAADRWMTVTVYGAQTRTNWLQYGAEDALGQRAEWEQARDDQFTVRLLLARPAWGWRTFWDEAGNLVVRIRRAPAIDPRQPLRGRLIAVDAGHPPGGAIGPTRLTEAEANLGVAKELVRLLRDAGARVIETRPDTAAVSLEARTQMAVDSSADLLVSLHNNAFPDGVNPFANSGTTAFYNAPQSLELARGLQHELLEELGLRDLGIARADLALIRTPWMPSSLTETMFLMVPRQENALRDPEVRRRIARAHLRAIEAFFRAEGARR